MDEPLAGGETETILAALADSETAISDKHDQKGLALHVSLADIRPELRARAALLGLLLLPFNERRLRAAGRATRLLRGMHTRKLHYEQRDIDGPNGGKLRLCIYTPHQPRPGVPGLLWMHGGGYAIGAPEQGEAFIRRFIEASGCVVVAPDYTLSIDAPYPAALEDCYAALLWLKANAGKYGVRTDQLMVGGDSAGGGLAAALSLYARDRGEVAIAFQMPLYPMLDDRMDTESARDNNAPAWNSKSSEAAWRLYLDKRFGTNDVPAYAAPARAADLGGLPPACFYVGSLEPFRDEAKTYAERLQKSGVRVRFRVFDGCFHAFDMLCGRTAVAREATAFLLDAFRHASAHCFAEQPVR